METNNDFIGSFAQENVKFQTQVVKTARLGDSYWKLMIFVENDRYIKGGLESWAAVPGSETAKAIAVNVDNFADVVLQEGLLFDWLSDFFANSYTGDCILVACGAKPSEGEDAEHYAPFIKTMTEAYELMKAYAYHKTVCVGTTLSVDVAVAFAKLCEKPGDKGLLSSAPYFPYTTATPESTESDLLYTQLMTQGADAFMSCHSDATRNGALYSLGLALTIVNGSGTSVGNSMDMIKSYMITPSGPKGTVLPAATKAVLEKANIQYFKPVGDNTGAVAASGALTIKGECVQAEWIKSYITYMTKVAIAQIMTVPNFIRNANNYSKIVGKVAVFLNQFGPTGSGRLSRIAITAPAFTDLPETHGDEYIIENAWSATYTDQVRTVHITGNLYLGG